MTQDQSLFTSMVIGLGTYVLVLLVVALCRAVDMNVYYNSERVPKWFKRPTKIKHLFGIAFLWLYVVLLQVSKIINRIMEIDLPKPKICPYCGESDCWGMKNGAVKGVKQPSCSQDSRRYEIEQPIRRYP